MRNKTQNKNRTEQRKISFKEKIQSQQQSRMNMYVVTSIVIFSFFVTSVAAAKYLTSKTPLRTAPMASTVDLPLDPSDIILNSSSDKFMTLSMKKDTYKKYITKCLEIETNALKDLQRLDTKSRQTARKIVFKKVRLLQSAEINKMQNRLKKKILDLPKSYISEVIHLGRFKKW